MKSLTESITPLAQRQRIPEEEKKKEQPVQMKSTLQRTAGEESVDADASIEQQLGQSSGKGSPLHICAFLYGAAVGADFSSIRVHTGSDASQLNPSPSAQGLHHWPEYLLWRRQVADRFKFDCP